MYTHLKPKTQNEISRSLEKLDTHRLIGMWSEASDHELEITLIRCIVERMNSNVQNIENVDIDGIRRWYRVRRLQSNEWYSIYNTVDNIFKKCYVPSHHNRRARIVGARACRRAEMPTMREQRYLHSCAEASQMQGVRHKVLHRHGRK